jgi:DNA-binding response OmpR family regulator
MLRSASTAGGHHRIHLEDLQELKKKYGMESCIRTERAEKRVLIVDDDPNIRKILNRALSSDGYDVKWASDGFEAGIKTIKFQPNVIILDLFMPQMDGFEVCRQLKNNKDTANIQVIAMSGFATKENRMRILECGADLFLPKPIDIPFMRKEIARILILKGARHI